MLTNVNRKAFGNHIINLLNGKYEYLDYCVWHGPKGFSSKPVLRQIYGDGLDRLFREILKIPNATSAEAQEYLEHLRNNASTTMEDVTEVYVFLQDHCAIPWVECSMLNGMLLIPNRFSFDDKTACIAMPSLSGSILEWKSPAQCVWNDDEFSQNKLKLESKIAIRSTVEWYAPKAKAFFTDILKLPNAGIDELLEDLALMQKMRCDNPKRVHRLYERIESCRHRSSKTIMHVSTLRS